ATSRENMVLSKSLSLLPVPDNESSLSPPTACANAKEGTKAATINEVFNSLLITSILSQSWLDEKGTVPHRTPTSERTVINSSIHTRLYRFPKENLNSFFYQEVTYS